METTTRLFDFYRSMVESHSLPDSHPKGTYAENARKMLEKLEFPNSKHEDWKYLRLAPLTKANWTMEHPGKPVPTLFFPIENFREHYDQVMVFVNGHYRADCSKLNNKPGIEIMPLPDDLDSYIGHFGPFLNYEANPFSALHTAAHQSGYFIRCTDQYPGQERIAILHYSDGESTLNQPFNLISVEKNAQLSLSEYHLGNGKTFRNGGSYYMVAQNAELRIDLMQKGGAEHYAINQIDAVVESNARFSLNTVTLSGKLTRNNVNVRVKGSNAEANLYGFYIPSDSEVVDNHTIIDHIKPHSQSNELYRGVLSGQSTGVFNGKVFVRQEAQKTNAYQSNANILIGDDATMNSKPELEIYADDVKCSHGSTIGQLDQDAIFYLRARGLSLPSAQRMLLSAFADAVTEKLQDQAIERILRETISQKLG